MRLIDVRTFEIQEFIGNPSQVPSYAILSHTWGEEEVSFQDMQDLARASEKEGFKKIEYCCKQAIEDGWDWAWVDTCCIDKTSSSELSEAINSMYKWYAASMVCYAYISDVSVPAQFLVRTERTVAEKRRTYDGRRKELGSENSSHEPVSRWFFRGWTLQELIAPFTVIFYTKSWARIGTKMDWSSDISKVTGIPVSILEHSSSINNVSALNRMRWASTRQTTRIEDTAYCLLGLFDINMPLLYGEGAKAFLRLQEQILQTTDDHTLLIWRSRLKHEDAEIIWGRKLFWDQSDSELCDMLATRPIDFDRSLPIKPMTFEEFSDPQVTTRDLGLRLTLPLRQAMPKDFDSIKRASNLIRSIEHVYLAALNCEVVAWQKNLTGGISGRVVLFLYRINGSAKDGPPLLFCRIRFLLHMMPSTEIKSWPRRTFYVRGPMIQKQKRLFNGINDSGSVEFYRGTITRRFQSETWIDITVGGIAGFLLEKPGLATSLFISCTIQIDKAFCHAQEIGSNIAPEDIDKLWGETNTFGTNSVRPWKPILNRYGPIYTSSQQLGDNTKLVLCLKREEGDDTDSVYIYMKISQ